MKKIIISELEHTSKLGRSVLKNVPVWVVEDLGHKFNPLKDEYSLDGDTIFYLEREVAKTWLRNFVTHNNSPLARV